MIIKEIVQMWNPKLYKKTKFVKTFGGKRNQKIIEDLIDTMRHFNLVWLAAPQIWKWISIFVTEITQASEKLNAKIDPVRVFINPKIVWKSTEETVMYEWCGSVVYGNVFWPVKRPQKIIVEAYDQNWEFFKLEADGLLAKIIQHEYDHLDWVEFVEKVLDMTKVLSREQYREMFLNK